MANNGNLRLFKKGDPRTIAAAKKSKRKPLDLRVQEILENAAEKDKKKRPYIDLVIHALLVAALKGHVMATRELLNRGYGQASITVGLNTMPGVPKEEVDNLIKEYEKIEKIEKKKKKKRK